jgi:hypothetical protein
VKRLLLSLCLVGAAVYMLTPPREVPERETEDTPVAQTQVHHPMSGPLRSSWGSTLESLRQDPQAPAANSQQVAAPRQNAAYAPRLYQENEDSKGTLGVYNPAASADKPSALAIDALEQEAVEWTRVTLAARVHSEPSVSSPVVGFYRPGTEAQVVGRKRGWFQLSDPVTKERGWVFEKYLVSIDGPRPSQTAMESASEPPPAKVTSPESQKPSRSAKPAVQVSDDVEVAKSDRRRGRLARRGDRRRGLGLVGFRGRKAGRAAWSIGPAQ